MTMAAISAALSVPVGAMLGAVYDVIRILRLLFSVDTKSPFGGKGYRRWFSYIFTALGDLFFFAVAAVVLCVFFYLTGDGRMRGYGLVGAYIGFVCYYHTVGRLVLWLARRITQRVRAFFCRIAQCFCKMPIVRRMHARYNEYIEKRKASAAAKKRKRRMRKSRCYVKN